MVSFLFGCVEVIDEFLDIGRFSPNRSRKPLFLQKLPQCSLNIELHLRNSQKYRMGIRCFSNVWWVANVQYFKLQFVTSLCVHLLLDHIGLISFLRMILVTFVLSSGLNLELNIEQDEYLDSFTPEAGVRVDITNQGQMPFPLERGLSLAPGFSTAIGLRKVSTVFCYLY